MARRFDPTAPAEYLDGPQTVTAVPLSVSAWVKLDAVGASARMVVTLGDTNALSYFVLGMASTEVVTFVTRNGGSIGQALSSGSIAAGSWHHVAGVTSAANSRAAYLNGTDKGTDAVSVTPSGIDNTTIAIAKISSGLYNPWDGDIAEVGLWDVALTDAEVEILAKGYSPLFVRPQNLFAFWPLIRVDNDKVGGYDMTPQNSPTWAGHVAALHAGAPHIVTAPAVAPTGRVIMIGGGLIAVSDLLRRNPNLNRRNFLNPIRWWK